MLQSAETVELANKATQTEQIQSSLSPPIDESDISFRYVIVWSVILGLMMTWMASYLKISMGFVSVGVGPMAVLLIARHIFKRKNLATRKNLTLVIITYSATTAAEASVGILFLIWLFSNPGFFGTFNAPWWLLPSQEVIASRSILSPEWLVPLSVHYFLMLIPGIVGLVLGWMMKDGFIHDEEVYPFPGVISQNSQVAVLTDESETKGPQFWRFVKYAFGIAAITTFIPFLFVIDFSNTSQGYIFGFMLGPVGIALIGAGLLIGNPKISIGSAISSIVCYSILGIFLVTNPGNTDFYSFFNLLLQDFYFSPAIGLFLGGLIVGPILWGIVKSFLKKKEKSVSEVTETDSVEQPEQDISELHSDNQVKKGKIRTFIGKNWKFLLVFAVIYFAMVFFVQSLQLIPSAPLWIIAVMIFWMTIVGGVVNGYLITQGIAKANTAIAPPFIFDVAAIYAAGGRGFTAYLAMPSAETDGSAGIVSSQRLAKLNGISPKTAVLAYLIGYFATTIMTPIFALIMWKALGIGTAQFPAPAFPVQGAILASFASGNPSSFLNLQLLLFGILAGILIAGVSSNVVMGFAIGMLFPPHMAIMLAIGGILRIVWDRKMGKDAAKEKSATVGPGIAVGASFVIPIMIILAFLM